jgi:hypothetical protein
MNFWQKLKADKKLFVLFILAIGLFGFSLGITLNTPFGVSYIFVIITMILLGYLLFNIIKEEGE